MAIGITFVNDQFLGKYNEEIGLYRQTLFKSIN